MELMRYWTANCCDWSVLTFPIFTLPAYSPASSSSMGAIILHGPHHSAQKSTTTGVADLRTSCSKFDSDRETMFAAVMGSRRLGSIGLSQQKLVGRSADAYWSCFNNSTLTTAPRPITAAAMARPTSKPLTRLAAGNGAWAGGRGPGAPGGRGAGLPVEVGGRGADGAVGAPEVGGRGGPGATDGAGVNGLGGEGAAGGEPGAVGAGAPGIEGNLIVAVAEGFGGRLMRTVSFLGWTLAASPGRGGTPPGGGVGAPPIGAFGSFSAINRVGFCLGT